MHVRLHKTLSVLLSPSGCTAADGMKHWRVTAEGGDGFQIEDNDSDYSVQPLDEKALGEHLADQQTLYQ